MKAGVHSRGYLQILTFALVIVMLSGNTANGAASEKNIPYKGVHTPANNSYIVIDSSRGGRCMWPQIQECLAYNPAVKGLEFVCWNYSTGMLLNVSQADDAFSFWLTDHGMYSGQLGPPLHPCAVASGDSAVGGPHISFAFFLQDISGGMGAQYQSYGWWSSSWDYPVDIGPGYVKALRNIGKQLANGNLLFIGLTAEDFSGNSRIIYRTYSPDLSTQIASGFVDTGYRIYWGFDINDGIAYIFYYDTLMNVNYRTTVDGVSWSQEQPYAMVWPSPFDSNLVFWTQAVVTGSGEPKLIFDNIDYDDYIQGNYPYIGRIYVSPGSGQTCRELSVGRERNLYPTIAVDGNHLIGLWHSAVTNDSDSLTFWNLYYNYSPDGGLTWRVPQNMTGNFGYRHGLAQLAKRMDATSGSPRFFYVFGQDIAADIDPIWHCWKQWQASDPMRWYWGSEPVGVEEYDPAKPGNTELRVTPNPVRSHAKIIFSLRNGGPVTLKLYTADGRTVKTVFNGRMKKGLQQTTLPVRDLRNGVYFLQIITPEGRSIGSTFVIAR